MSGASEPLTALLGSIGNLFTLMGIAEEEMKSAAKRYPRRADAVGKAFPILMPTMGMERMNIALYEDGELLSTVYALEYSPNELLFWANAVETWYEPEATELLRTAATAVTAAEGNRAFS